MPVDIGPEDSKKAADYVAFDSLESAKDSDVCLHLKDVREGIFVKYDWIFLNDRILFVRMAGIGRFVSGNILRNYSAILGSESARQLISKLNDLRKKKTATLSAMDVFNILKAEKRNSEMLYAEMNRVLLERRMLGGCRVTIVSKTGIRKSDVPRTKVSRKNLALFFKARVGSRFVEV